MELKIEYLPLNQIKPYDKNARKHADEDVNAIIESIKEFGFSDPIGIWGEDNVIVEGHGRLTAAKKLKLKKVPVVRLDHLTDEQRRAYALAHNKTAELSEWDDSFLNIELDDIIDIDMSKFGFDIFEDEPEPEQEEVPDEFEDVEKLDKHYGVPYQGNKSRIADIIITALPQGERLVDLFGGGGAITHCAMLSGKWNAFLYNDINPLITTFFMDAINGKYHDETRVITREDFERLKNTDPYVKYLWSFGNNGTGYLWGQDIEEIKVSACHSIMDESPAERRKAYIKYTKLFKEKAREIKKGLIPVERLQSLEQLEALQRLEVSNLDYHDYQYKEGDIVYCDVPYEQVGKKSCDDYGVQFDSLEFYKWAKSREYQVFFSSYEISDKDFYSKKVKSVMRLIGANTNGSYANEYLYSNMPI